MPVCDDQGEIVKQSRFLQQLAKKFETWIFTNGTFDGIEICYSLQIIFIYAINEYESIVISILYWNYSCHRMLIDKVTLHRKRV